MKRSWSLALALVLCLPFAGNAWGQSELAGIAAITDTSGEAQVTETIRERYADGKTKIEREMAQDESGNYIHQGSWKMFNPRGQKIGEGQYENDLRQGVWNRWYRQGEAKLFSQALFSQFTAPFVSQATFDAGQIDGVWIISDAKQRKIVELHLVDGEREGKETWWHSNGRKSREVDYHKGVIDGKVQQWNTAGKLTVNNSFEDGRKIGKKTSSHKDIQKKKDEGSYLYARIVTKTLDDWWNAKLATYERVGKDERHGSWVSWHTNGKIKEQGEYDHSVRIGRFTWWYSSGQKQSEGSFVNGKKQGNWVWWHANGLKKTEGAYARGNPIARWTYWHDTGKVSQAADFSSVDPEIAETPQPTEKAASLPLLQSAPPALFKR